VDEIRRIQRAKALAHSDLGMRIELIEIRRRSGLSQKDVAKALGVTQQAVSAFERLESDPRLSTVRQYAHAVGALIAHEVRPDQGTDSDLEWLSGHHKLKLRVAPGGALELPVQGPKMDSVRTDFALAS